MAEEAAKEVLMASGHLPVEQELMTPDEAKALVAMEAVCEVILARNEHGIYLYPVKERLSAARTVLDFTRAKPVARQEIKVETAETYLLDLIRKEEGDQ